MTFFLFFSETAENHHTQTLIKRTFYQESFISGTNVEMPELKELLLTPNVQTTYATTTKSSMTTCVTLNMRKCRRRSSDVGSIAHQSSRPNINIDVSSGQGYSPRMPDVRHSICGSPILIQKSMSGADSEQCSNGTPSNSIQMANDQLQMSTCSINLKGGVFQNKVRNLVICRKFNIYTNFVSFLFSRRECNLLKIYTLMMTMVA